MSGRAYRHPAADAAWTGATDSRPTRLRRRYAAALLAALVLALAAGCGLPSSTDAVQVPRGDVPYGLMDVPTPSPPPTPGVPLAPATIFLADAQQRLVGVEVQLPAAPLQPFVQTLLDRLAIGPSDSERARGLVTDLGPGSMLALRDVTAGTATIELTTPAQDPSANKLPVAVGQIVLTATSVVGVDRVVFERNGTLLQVPGPSDGNLTSAPLVRDHYTALLAPGQPALPRTTPGAGSPVTAPPT